MRKSNLRLSRRLGFSQKRELWTIMVTIPHDLVLSETEQQRLLWLINCLRQCGLHNDMSFHTECCSRCLLNFDSCDPESPLQAWQGYWDVFMARIITFGTRWLRTGVSHVDAQQLRISLALGSESFPENLSCLLISRAVAACGLVDYWDPKGLFDLIRRMLGLHRT